MKVSDAGVEFIKRQEGLRLRAYQDAGGKLTIGWGHLIQEDDDIPLTITEREAERLLAEDVKEVELTLARYIDNEMSQEQIDSIASFVFNLGPQGLWNQKKKAPTGVLSAIRSGNYDAVPVQMLRWVYAGDQNGDGVVDYEDRVAGLVKRRQREGRLFAEGEYGS